MARDKRLTLILPGGLHQLLKIKSSLDDVPMKTIVIDVLTQACAGITASDEARGARRSRIKPKASVEAV